MAEDRSDVAALASEKEEEVVDSLIFACSPCRAVSFSWTAEATAGKG